MKKTKIIIGLFALSFMVNSIQAQESGTGEIAFGYGVVSTNEMGVVFVDILTTFGTEIIGIGSYGRENYKQVGPTRFSLKLTPHNRFTIGGALLYEHMQSDMTINDNIYGNQRLTFYTVALEFDYRYVSKEAFQMYFTLGAGATVMHEKFLPSESHSELEYFNELYDPYPNFHINLLGFRFGRKAAVFAELGLGYKGIANVGFSFQMH